MAVTATKFVTFSGLRYTNAVQTFYVGTTYIYALQRIDTDAILTRCDMTGARIDDMYLTNFGHSETLQWFSHKGISYFWIGTKGEQTLISENDTTYWATQLARITYDPSKTEPNDYNYTDATRLSSVIRANYDGSSSGNLTRFEAALSSDTDTPSKKLELLVLSINDASPRIGNYTIYDNEALNDILDTNEAADQKFTSFQDVTGTVLAYAPLNKFHAYGEVANESIQGLEFSDGRAMYFTSGSKTQETKIQKSLWEFTSNEVQTISDGTVGVTETEGIQLKGDDIYFAVAHYTGDSVSDNYIYTVPKSIFS